MTLFRRLAIATIAAAALSAPSVSAGTHFTLRGSATSSNLGLNKQDARSASASIAVDVGTYFRIGVTHRQALNTVDGYRRVENTDSYLYEAEKTHNKANSLDLTFILYYGRLFVPYIQVGLVKKEYLIVSRKGDDAPVRSHIPIDPVPYGGLGMGIRLNNRFSLKLSYTMSPGIKIKAPDAKPEGVMDSFTSVGISYNI